MQGVDLVLGDLAGCPVLLLKLFILIPILNLLEKLLQLATLRYHDHLLLLLLLPLRDDVEGAVVAVPLVYDLLDEARVDSLLRTGLLSVPDAPFDFAVVEDSLDK